MTGISMHLQWPLTPQSHGSSWQKYLINHNIWSQVRHGPQVFGEVVPDAVVVAALHRRVLLGADLAGEHLPELPKSSEPGS
jgi:hypothetical protein